MATGIVGAMSGAGSISYTPPTAAKVKITSRSVDGHLLNGISIITTGSLDLYVGAGQTITVAAVNGSNVSNAQVIISAVES